MLFIGHTLSLTTIQGQNTSVKQCYFYLFISIFFLTGKLHRKINMETTQGAGVDFTGLLGSMLHALIEPVTGAAGGYPDSMFLNLNEEEKENNGCNIW